MAGIGHNSGFAPTWESAKSSKCAAATFLLLAIVGDEGIGHNSHLAVARLGRDPASPVA